MTWVLLILLWAVTIVGIVVYLVLLRKHTESPAIAKAVQEVSQAMDPKELQAAFDEAKKKEIAQDGISKTEGDDLVSSDLSKRGFR